MTLTTLLDVESVGGIGGISRSARIISCEFSLQPSVSLAAIKRFTTFSLTAPEQLRVSDSAYKLIF